VNFAKVIVISVVNSLYKQFAVTEFNTVVHNLTKVVFWFVRQL